MARAKNPTINVSSTLIAPAAPVGVGEVGVGTGEWVLLLPVEVEVTRLLVEEVAVFLTEELVVVMLNELGSIEVVPLEVVPSQYAPGEGTTPMNPISVTSHNEVVVGVLWLLVGLEVVGVSVMSDVADPPAETSEEYTVPIVVEN